MQLLVEVSVGEALDKLTILELKMKRIADPAKLINVRNELDALTATLALAIISSAALDRLKAELFEINAALWDIEDRIRGAKPFRTLARSSSTSRARCM